jgi:ATP-dependent helicase/nuclease subunit B
MAAREYLIILPNQRLVDDAAKALATKAQRLGREAVILPDIVSLNGLGDALGRSTLLTELGLPEALLPIIPHSRRIQELTRLVQDSLHATALPFAQAFRMASDLASLIDAWAWYELDFNRLQAIAPSHLASHWQQHLNALELISALWPKRLASLGMIEAATHTVQVVQHIVKHYPNSPHHFVLAGVVHPAPLLHTLAKTIAAHPKGLWVLAGYERSVTQPPPHHPAYLQQRMLAHTGIAAADVPDMVAHDSVTPTSKARQDSIAAHLHDDDKVWAALPTTTLAEGLNNVSLVACPTLEDEARCIALKIRDTVEHPTKTIAVVTPHRGLTQRIRLMLSQWGIVPNTSDGSGLEQSLVGRFLRLLVAVAQDPCDAITLLGLLKHPLCALGGDAAQTRAYAQHLETRLFRHKLAPYTLEIIDFHSRDYPTQWHGLKTILTLSHAQTLRRILERLQTIATETSAGKAWHEADGQAAHQALQDWQAHTYDQALSLDDVAVLLGDWLQQVSLHTGHGQHPRVFLWGWLESQLQRPDVLIMASLTDGVLPPKPAPSLWLNAAMHNVLGLPSPEAEQGFAAHIYRHNLHAAEVMLTYAQRDGDSPQLPSVWLQRWQALCAVQKYPWHSEWRERAARFYTQSHSPRPEPLPKPASRPHRLSATNLELLVKNPYGYYAKEILGLHKAKEIARAFEAADYGSLVHGLLCDFVRAYPDTIDDSAAAWLFAQAKQRLTTLADSPDITTFRLAQLEAVLQHYLQQERRHRQHYQPWQQEEKAEWDYPLSDSRLTFVAKVDRMDIHRATQAAHIIDYKTGNAPSKSAVNQHFIAWQLTLAGMMVQAGAFGNASHDVDTLHYWPIKLNSTATTITVDDDFWANAQACLDAIVCHYWQSDTPYLVWPHPDIKATYDDYAHLARRDEWV